MDTNDTQELVVNAAANRVAQRLALFEKNEVEVNFSSEPDLACCGEVLRPFWADDGGFISVCSRCGQKYRDKSQVRYKASPWIGVDLDGTLAQDLGNKHENRGLGRNWQPDPANAQSC